MKNPLALAARTNNRCTRRVAANLLVLLLGFVLLLCCGEAAACGILILGDNAIGRTEEISMPTLLVRPFRGIDPVRNVIVYTPAGYDDPVNASRHYPVVYLLHGAPGNPQNFLKFGKFPEIMEREVQNGVVQPCLLVMPDGNYVGDKHGDSEWADSADGHDRFETWILTQIVPWIDDYYRTRAEPSGRFLAGVSAGALGAVNLALRNPRVFGGAIGISGYYEIRHSGWGHTIMHDDSALMANNSPLVYVRKQIVKDSSAGDWKDVTIFLGAGAGESLYADATIQMATALRAAGVNAVYVAMPKGAHNWKLWSRLFDNAITDLLPASRGTTRKLSSDPSEIEYNGF